MIHEQLISIDVETAGPTPGEYALLSVGACLVDDIDTGFYVELQPDRDASLPEALAVSGLDLSTLRRDGTAAPVAMAELAAWVRSVSPEPSHRAIFVAFNAPFDWMFVQEYFARYAVVNPFGHSAMDIKAYYAGYTGCTWNETSMRFLADRYLGGETLSHNALADARDQAQLLRAIQAEAASAR